MSHQNVQRKGVPSRLLQDRGEDHIRHHNAILLKKSGNALPIQKEVLRVQDRHHTCGLEGNQPAGGLSAAQKHKLPLRILPDQGAQLLLLLLIGQILQIVYEQQLPLAPGRRQVEIGNARRGSVYLSAGNQLPCRRGLSTAAGRTEQQHASMVQCRCHLLFQPLRQDHLFCHRLSLLCCTIQLSDHIPRSHPSLPAT